MAYVKDFKWKKGIKVSEYVDSLANIGFQSTQLANAAEVFVKMKRNSAKIFLTFTSNMVTSGLRGFFAQLIKLGLPPMKIS